MKNAGEAIILLAVAAICLSGKAQAAEALQNAPIHDAQGREVIPGGFVTITQDRLGDIHYTQDDYRRTVRMGANFVVIRVMLGRIGGWPGKKEDPAHFERLDSMVHMAREVGLQTIFKLVVYNIKPFAAAQWAALYNNTNGAQDALLAGWKKIWVRYKDEPSVFG